MSKKSAEIIRLERQLAAIERKITQRYLNKIHTELKMMARLFGARAVIQQRIDNGDLAKHLRALVALKCAELARLRKSA